MLHLVYRIQLTEHAEDNPHAFWAWVQERERWFYQNLDTVIATQWRIRTIGEAVHTLEHTVTFSNEAAWGRYRRQISERSRDPEWEQRHTEQNRWWRLLDASLLSDPPVALGLAPDRHSHPQPDEEPAP